jgi:hypothetical protein
LRRKLRQPRNQRINRPEKAGSSTMRRSVWSAMKLATQLELVKEVLQQGNGRKGDCLLVSRKKGAIVPNGV